MCTRTSSNNIDSIEKGPRESLLYSYISLPSGNTIDNKSYVWRVFAMSSEIVNVSLVSQKVNSPQPQFLTSATTCLKLLSELSNYKVNNTKSNQCIYSDYFLMSSRSMTKHILKCDLSQEVVSSDCPLTQWNLSAQSSFIDNFRPINDVREAVKLLR